VRLAARVGAVAAALALASAWVITPASMAAHWSKPSKVPGVKRLEAVSCVSRSFCMAVGGRNAVAFRSGAWRRPQTISSHHALTTVSCASTTFCAAADPAGEVSVYNGKSWSPPTSLATTGGLSRLSCAARTFCGALGVNGDAFLYNGSSWSAPQRIPGASQPQLISCPVVGFCMAMDFADAFRLSGGSWAGAGSVRPSNPQGGSEPNVASALSCSGRHFCAALDDFGEAFTWASGRGWSRPHRFDRNLLDGSDAVSCRARTACMAVDGNGVATRWNGTAWSPKQPIDTSQAGLRDVSCGTARFCVAVDFRARALIYR
jgi:hypothetical protein